MPQALDAAIKYERDFAYDFFAFKTLERSYLVRCPRWVAHYPRSTHLPCPVRYPLCLSDKSYKEECVFN